MDAGVAGDSERERLDVVCAASSSSWSPCCRCRCFAWRRRRDDLSSRRAVVVVGPDGVWSVAARTAEPTTAADEGGADDGVGGPPGELSADETPLLPEGPVSSLLFMWKHCEQRQGPTSCIVTIPGAASPLTILQCAQMRASRCWGSVSSSPKMASRRRSCHDRRPLPPSLAGTSVVRGGVPGSPASSWPCSAAVTAVPGPGRTIFAVGGGSKPVRPFGVETWVAAFPLGCRLPAPSPP